MPCDFPIKCEYWNEKEEKCSLSPEEFQRMCDEGYNPCEEHQGYIDTEAIDEMVRAIERGNYEYARAIAKSPYVSFGRW